MAWLMASSIPFVAPAGCRWQPEQEDDDWLPANPGQRCTQPRCGRPAIIQLRRSVSRRYADHRAGELYRWWGCCDKADHRYGRWLEDGKVWHWRLIEAAS